MQQLTELTHVSCPNACVFLTPSPSHPLRPTRQCQKATSTWQAPPPDGLSSWQCCQSPSGQVSMWVLPWRSSPTCPRTITGSFAILEHLIRHWDCVLKWTRPALRCGFPWWCAKRPGILRQTPTEWVRPETFQPIRPLVLFPNHFTNTEYQKLFHSKGFYSQGNINLRSWSCKNMFWNHTETSHRFWFSSCSDQFIHLPNICDDRVTIKTTRSTWKIVNTGNGLRLKRS